MIDRDKALLKCVESDPLLNTFNLDDFKRNTSRHAMALLLFESYSVHCQNMQIVSMQIEKKDHKMSKSYFVFWSFLIKLIKKKRRKS